MYLINFNVYMCSYMKCIVFGLVGIIGRIIVKRLIWIFVDFVVKYFIRLSVLWLTS